MTKVINVQLNSASIDAAIRELRNYEKWLYRKSVVLRERVAYFIAKDASTVFNTSIAEDDLWEGAITGSVEVSVEPKGENITLVIASGKDAVFMEFGAGVYYNGAVGTSPNPLGVQLGLTIGSYGLGNGKKEVWGYTGEDGKIHLTHGAPASMPLYRAVVSVANDIEQIAREVFST